MTEFAPVPEFARDPGIFLARDLNPVARSMFID